MLNGKGVLITGGTGSFGKRFVDTIFERYPEVRRVVVYSRDELKQFEMAQHYPKKDFPQIRFFIGDVRDRERLKLACHQIDVIIHAAALKQVPIAEYNPMEAIKTNVIGAENVIHAALETNVEKVVALSTDKAAAPINLYGATKLCSDKLFIAANNMRNRPELRFSVVRYGNVIGSRGSVVPFFLRKRHDGFLPITHKDMTRFNISLDEGVEMVLYALQNAWGGELFVPKIPSFKITDLAEAVAPGIDTRIIGVRPGEKLHEEMITETDSLNTVELKDYFVIMPSMPLWSREDFIEAFNGRNVDYGFRYSSGTNDQWLGVDAIRAEIRKHVDPDFQPLNV